MSKLLTPFLTANPEYLDTLIQLGYDPRGLIATETANLSVLDGSRVVYSTGEKATSLLFMSSPNFRYWQNHKRTLRYQLSYTATIRGLTQRRVVWLNPPKSISRGKRGRIEVVLDPTALGYPSALRKVRTSVQRSFKSPKRDYVDPRTKRTRPSPETRITKSHSIEEKVVGGVYSFSDLQNHSPVQYERTWTGVRTPGYWSMRPSQLPVNPHTVSIQEVSTNRYFHMDDRRPYGLKDYLLQISAYTLRYAPPAAPVHLPLATNKAIRRLIEQAGQGIETDLAQSVGELGQVIRMLGTNTKRIIDSVSNLKRGNFQRAIDSLTAGRTGTKYRNMYPNRKKDLAENWLELQYGWKPLLNDIHGAFTALNVFALSRNVVYRVTASASASSKTANSVNSLLGIGYPKLVHNVEQHTRVKFTMNYEIEDALKTYLGQTGFTNPVNLAWELLPFSFVADWFLPIGHFLQTLSAWDGLKFVDGCKTVFTRQNVGSRVSAEVQQLGNGTHWYSHHASYRREWILLNRTKLTAFPTPSFLFEPRNGFAGESGVKRGANAVALVIALFT